MNIKRHLLGLTFFATTLAACSGQATESSQTSSSSEQISYNYGNDEMYANIWEGNVVYNETCLLTEDDDGVFKARLLYTPTRIISVRDYTLEKEYKTSEYKIEGDYIIKTESSTMPSLTKKEVTCEDISTLNGTISTYAAKNGSILFTEGTGIVARHIAVTYEHADKWIGSIPSKQGSSLPNLQAKLAAKQKIKMVVNGDSIFTGCNSSGKLGIRPFQDDFPTGFKNEITRRYGSDVVLTNTAAGGQMSSWGLSNVMSNINQYDPDLVIIGFGMNDGCDAYRVKPDIYVENIETMIKSIQFNCTNPEIIVCATIVANPDSTQAYLQEDYLTPLKEMVANYEGVVLMDMTTFSKDMLKKKKSLDLYANNINHPADLMVRSYVMNLMTTIEK